MNDEIKKNVLRLRLIVGFLGERTQFNWWPTAFYESSSRLFLEPIYTKTSVLAQYHGVLEAARRLHDEHLNIGSYHLFRLPEEVEHALYTLVSNNINDNPIFNSPDNKKNALEKLKDMAGNNKTVNEGPMVVGKIEDLESIQAVQKTAGAYLAALEQSIKVYPYFVR